MKRRFWKKNDTADGKNGEKSSETPLQNLRVTVIMTP
jgi:hypothetical protein